jgi:ribosomal protein L37AE/L43A
MTKPLIDNFIPVCPLCKEPMPLIQGQKKGAWNCLKCGSQFWDEVEEVALGEPDKTSQKILCLRCKLPMIPYKGVWYCEQCYGQFWPEERAPEIEKIVDQKIKCGTKDLKVPDGGFRTYTKAKNNKYHSTKSKGRSKKPQLERFYYFD